MRPDYRFWVHGMSIFPILMPVVMLVALYLIFGRGNQITPR